MRRSYRGYYPCEGCGAALDPGEKCERCAEKEKKKIQIELREERSGQLALAGLVGGWDWRGAPVARGRR